MILVMTNMTFVMPTSDRKQFTIPPCYVIIGPMEERGLEPGLLRIFRLFIISRMGVIVLGAGVFLQLAGRDIPGLLAIGASFVADVVFLVIFLCWPWLRRRLGQAHLPTALFLVTFMQLAEIRYFANSYGLERLWAFWLIFPFLTVPLILTAWQYSYTQVALFSLGTMLLELAWTPGASPWRTVQLISTIGVLIGRSIVFMLIGYIITHLMEEQREQRRRLAEANTKLVQYAATLEELAVTRERNRLARELHDTLAHTLSGLAVQLDAIASLRETAPERSDEMLGRALVTTRDGLDETRRALHDLRASPLEALGLSLAVRNLAESAAARAGFSLDLDIPEPLMGLTPEAEQAFYRIAQEALENVLLHADAQHVAVSLKRAQDLATLIVRDDGRGLPKEGTGADRFGLRGMEERARLIGGRLSVQGGPDGGTVVTLRLEAAR